MEKLFYGFTLFLISLPLLAIVKWRAREDRTHFPFLKVLCCFLGTFFLIIYGQFGPFYTVAEYTDAMTAQEYFKLLAKEQLPIKFVLFLVFAAQFGLLGWLVVNSPDAHGFLLFAFGVLGIYCSCFALLYAADSLFIGGLT
ncbi:MAG: hypothetical protein V3U65_14090 [Granulosicoccaceae bacterium]